MDFRKVLYFHCVAKYMNFSKAAEEYHIAQTAMSRAIANLESELGFKLFNRDHHVVELTPAGKHFLEQTKEVLRIYSSAQQVGLEIAKGWEDSLTIGFGGYEAGFIKKYVPPFLEKYPSYSVILLEYPYQQIVQELIAKSCDVVICPEIRVRDHSNIKYIKVSNARYTITVSKDNPLAKLDKIPPELLNGMTFICPSDKNSNWQMIEAFHKICDDFGIVPGKLIYSNTTLAIMQMVEMDLGITMLSSAFSSYSSFDVRNIPIDTKVKARKVHTVACLEPITRPIVSKFMDYVQEAASLSMSSRNGEVLK